jgi:hypothetical protein
MNARDGSYRSEWQRSPYCSQVRNVRESGEGKEQDLQFDQQNTLTQDQLYRAHRAVGEGIMVGRFVIKDELREIKRRELGQRGSARIKKN